MNVIVRPASLVDAAGIMALLRANHVDSVNEEEKKDGFVTTNLTDRQLADLITKENGIVVAENESGIVGFAMAASWQFWSEWPLFAYMIKQLPKYRLDGIRFTPDNTYQYGPVCVKKNIRGYGVFEKLFYASLTSMKHRYPYMVTFINHINPRSYQAHTKKVQTTDMGTFQFNNNNYHLMACATSLTPKE